jgi:hypothetical protein
VVPTAAVLALLLTSAEGELTLELSPRGEAAYSARVGASVLLPAHHRLLVQLDSKVLAGELSLRGRLTMKASTWLMSLWFLADHRGALKPQAAASLTLPPSSLGELVLSAKCAPLDESPWLVAAALSPRGTLVRIRLESSLRVTSVTVSFHAE